MKEELKEFYSKLYLLEGQEYMKKFLLYTVAPVVSGHKPSCTITFSKDGKNLYEHWKYYCKEFSEQTGLKYINLIENQTTIVTLIYNENSLESCLNKNNIKEFLFNLGYFKANDINDILNTLKERYNICNCPHELGIFLGIPLNDVKDFMNCTEKKCLMCGYWKVYNDFAKSKRIFNKYDEIKRYAMKGILKDVDVITMVSGLREKFMY